MRFPYSVPVRFAAAVVVAGAISLPAFANDALKGRWVGPVGSVQATLTIQNAAAGTLTGTMTAGNLNYTISGAAPSASNGQGTFQGAAVTIKTPGGTLAMQLQGNQLRGRYCFVSAISVARPRDESGV
jgi:hypothetical protein